MKGKKVRAVYPHQVGAIGFAVTAGIMRSAGDTSSPLLYCGSGSDTTWAPSDSGMSRNEMGGIRSLDGFPTPAICGETFAASGGTVYRKQTSVWEKVFDIGIGVVNVVKANERNATVWAGGETAIFAPYITRSDDKGKSWTTTFPNLAGDNACNSLAFDLNDTSVVYAGMEGAVIKSTNGGQAWSITSLQSTPFYFYGLALDQRAIYAGGSTMLNVAGLYKSLDGGTTWATIQSASSLKGILSLVAVTTFTLPQTTILLIGTNGDGVFQSYVPVTSVEDDLHPTIFVLHQNYPNPFNPSTKISYTLPLDAEVKLVVYDILGREVNILDEGMKPAGRYDVTWDGLDKNGYEVPGGVYFYRLQAGYHQLVRKMVIVR